MTSHIDHISDTAFLVAHHRAVESARADALFDDAFAARLAGEKGAAIAAAFPNVERSRWLLAIRTCVIDDFIREAMARGVDTIVNLGAGLDARPYRMELPATLGWIEVDYPHVMAYKAQHLATDEPRCQLERVGLDLSDGTARRALLARIDAQATRALVLTEGVVVYLDLGEAGALADDLRMMRHLDAWIVDYLSTQTHMYLRQTGVTDHMRATPFKFEPPDWHAFFAEHGFAAREIRYLPVEGERRGRTAPLQGAPPAFIQSQGFRESMGYALMEKA